jgi:predicted acetyltransferase
VTLPDLCLVSPRHELLSSYAHALRRRWSTDLDGGTIVRQLREIRAAPDAFLASLNRQGGWVLLDRGRRAPRLPYRLFWISDGDFSGTINLRYQPGTEALPPYISGHIGYGVVPWKRRRGYATRALAMILPLCRKQGLKRVLVTCDEDNIASRRVIEANGGEFDGTEPHPLTAGKLKLRYWVATGEPQG